VEVAVTIKLLILDVDGILADGTIYYGDNNTEIKVFNIKMSLSLNNR